MTSGERLREVMREKGWSAKRLSRESGVAYTTITRMLRGDLNGQLYTWSLVCETIGVSMDEVVRDSASS